MSCSVRKKERQSMGLFDLFRKSDEEIAEEYLRGECEPGVYYPGSIRHYHVSEVADNIERQTGARLTDAQTTRIVQKIRNEAGMGPIDAWNMPGYVDPDDYPEDQENTRVYNANRAIRDA